MDALHAIRQRRAVRRYTDRPVPDEEVARLLRLALHAPTGHGAQAWGFVVVRDPVRRVALAELVLRGAADTSASSGRPPRARAGRSTPSGRGATPTRALGTYRQVPVSISRVIVPRFWYDDPGMERIERFSDVTSVAFAIENLLVAARAVGLGTTPTNFHFFVEAEFRALLGLPEEVGVHYLTPLGYPPEFPTGLRPALAKARRPWRTLVHEETWDSTWG